MISWIIFTIGVIVSIGLATITNINNFAFWQILVIFIAALAILILLNAICAIFCSKVLSNKAFDSKNKFYIPSKAEIKFYNKIHIKKWKDKTLEWGKLNGFSKKNVEQPKDPEYIKKFILECNKGYLTHFTSLFIPALLFLCVPKTLILPMALPMFITSFLINYMSVAILRYNTDRLNTLLKFIERKSK